MAASQHPDLIDVANPANGHTAVHVAAGNGHPDVIETLVRVGSTALDRPDKRGRTPMHRAADEGHANVIETLVRVGSTALDQPDNEGMTPMHHTAANCESHVARTLLKLGSTAFDQPDKQGRTPIEVAVLNGSSTTVELLMAVGVDASAAREMPEWSCFEEVSPDWMARVREELYFSRSLLDRLVAALDCQRGANRRLASSD